MKLGIVRWSAFGRVSAPSVLLSRGSALSMFPIPPSILVVEAKVSLSMMIPEGDGVFCAWRLIFEDLEIFDFTEERLLPLSAMSTLFDISSSSSDRLRGRTKRAMFSKWSARCSCSLNALNSLEHETQI